MILAVCLPPGDAFIWRQRVENPGACLGGAGRRCHRETEDVSAFGRRDTCDPLHSREAKGILHRVQCFQVQKFFKTQLPCCENQTTDFAKNTHFFWAILAPWKKSEKFFC